MQNLTNEQQDVVAALGCRERLKVYALAGTGKTTTLKAIAALNPHQKMLYLAFNKAIADEAKGKFPPNVEVRTVHSLAYAHLGRLYRDRLSRLDYFEIAEALGMPVKAVFEKIHYFQAFLNSGCPLDRGDIAALLGRQGAMGADSLADFIIRLFQALKNGSLQVDHSFYLKDFQLNFKSFGLSGAYDVVLLDEGQDVNPVILSIFEQFQARKIMVGDKHQKIYGFRGAINAIEEFTADETLYLTRTFRFNGQEQVQAVNELLFHLKCEDNLMRPVATSRNGGKSTGCVITRSNAKLIETLLENPSLKTVRHPGQYFERFFNVFARKIRVPDTESGQMTFGNYLRGLKDMAETVGDLDLSSSIKLIKRNGCDLGMFKYLYGKAMNNFKNGGSTYLGTAHSTKGLEFDLVRLTDDFKTPRDILEQLLEDHPELYRRRGNGYQDYQDKVLIRRADLRNVFARLDDELIKEEINLLYVALTRAKKEIEIPRKYLISAEYVVDVKESSKSRSMVAASREPLF